MIRAGGVGGQLEDLLDRHRGVDGHRGLGQRAQLLHVLVLEPGDLLDLLVAAVDALERRQALAQEVGGGLHGGLRRLGRAAGQRPAQRRVMGLGEVEHREVRRHRLAPEVVGGAQAELAAVVQIRGERRGISGRQRGRAVGALLLVNGHGANSTDAALSGGARAAGRRCPAGRPGSSGPWWPGRRTRPAATTYHESVIDTIVSASAAALIAGSALGAGMWISSPIGRDRPLLGLAHAT